MIYQDLVVTRQKLLYNSIYTQAINGTNPFFTFGGHYEGQLIQTTKDCYNKSIYKKPNQSNHNKILSQHFKIKKLYQEQFKQNDIN